MWYSSLDSAYKLRWDTVLHKFKEEYHLDKPVLLVEIEIFQNFRLLNGQQLDDYFSKVVDKGRKINKSAQEILLKFIERLPSQLSFFVRAGNPENVQQACTSAKLGVAYGYRQQSTELTVSNMHQITSVTPSAVVTAISQPDRLTSLENKLEEFSKKLDDVKLLSSNTSTRKSNTVDIICYNCGQKGHSKRNCRSMSTSSVRCQLCDKNGHKCQKLSHITTAVKLQNPEGCRSRSLGKKEINKRAKRSPPSTRCTKLPVNSVDCVNSESDNNIFSKDSVSKCSSHFLYLQIQFNCKVSTLLDTGSSINLMSYFCIILCQRNIKVSC